MAAVVHLSPRARIVPISIEPQLINVSEPGCRVRCLRSRVGTRGGWFDNSKERTRASACRCAEIISCYQLDLVPTDAAGGVIDRNRSATVASLDRATIDQ